MTWSMLRTIWPGRTSPRSPPFLPEGQVEYFFASTSKASPLAMRFFSCAASASVFTRMCRAMALGIAALLGYGGDRSQDIGITEVRKCILSVPEHDVWVLWTLDGSAYI